jgi:hypothetical protein
VVYQTIEFADNMVIDIEVSAKKGLIDQLLIERGCRLSARIKPYVVETADGPVEVADLFIADGTASRRVPCACFRIVD